MSNTQNPFQPQQKPKTQQKPFLPHDNPIETLKDIGSGVKQTLTDDVLKKAPQDIFDSLFNTPQSGEYGKNPFELPFGAKKKQESPDEIRNRELLSPRRMSEEQALVKQQIEAVRQELAMLAKELGSLNQEVQKAIMEVPVDPGTYHLNFFERLKTTIQLLRKSVKDSRTWLQLSSSKKKQKGFWGMYKKHGTQFGLSADRTPATQTG